MSRLFFTFFLILVLASCKDRKPNNYIGNSNRNYAQSKNILSKNTNINDSSCFVSFLENSSDLESSRIGIEGRKSGSFQIYERYFSLAKEETLLSLTYNKDPKIRVYSMWALTKKNKKIALSRMKLLKDDTAIVVHKTGCISFSQKVCWLIATKFDSTEVVLKPKTNCNYLNYEVVIK